jgi:hypothetical protein
VASDRAIIGVSDHNGWAVLVSLSSDGAFLDRRRIELVDASLPKLPHHHEGQWAQGRTLEVPWARAILAHSSRESVHPLDHRGKLIIGTPWQPPSSREG